MESKVSKLLYLVLCFWYVYLINGEVIRAKSVTRGKLEPDFKIVTIDDRIVRVPFTSILKIEERNE